ncbi:MAG TPA: toprim domain-containing protein [Nannocystaceae bacterium]|nr:toprim domain-containing protein [Nannocystaceae bacterium]
MHPAREVDHTDPRNATKRALEIFESAAVVRPGDTVDRYLTGERGLVRPTAGWSVDIRLARTLRHPTGAYADAMVVLLRDVEGVGRAIQRSWLDRLGRKAELAPQRAALGCTGGCAVRLAPIAARVAICEGVEDALATEHMLSMPAWATCGAPGMRRVALPRDIREVIVVPDRDGAGVHAARELAYRLRSEGRHVSFRWPAAKDAAEEALRATRR